MPLMPSPLPAVDPVEGRLAPATAGPFAGPFAGPESAVDLPGSLSQFLAIERARERQRNAAARQDDIRIG